MADLAQLEAALVKADAAGDADGARVLAAEVRKMRASAQPGAIQRKAGEMALEGMTGTERFLAGAGKGMTDVGRGIGQLLGLSNQSDIDEARQHDAALTNDGYGLAGDVAGNLALTAIPGVGALGLLARGATTLLPRLIAPTAAAAGSGAIIGAATTPTATGETRTGAAVAGAAGGAAGDATARLAGRVVQPIMQSPAVKRLLGEGIVPTPGQAAGADSFLGRTEQKLQSLFGVGDIVKMGRERAGTEFNMAALNKAVPEGQRAATELGQTGVDQAKSAISAQYDKALAGKSMQPDAELWTKISDAKNIPMLPLSDVREKQFDSIIKRVIGDRIGKLQPGDQIAAHTVKAEIDHDLGTLSFKLSRSPMAEEQALGEAVKGARDAVRDWMTRQTGTSAERAAADAAHANKVALQKAVERAKASGGKFTPYQLQSATREGMPLRDLANDAQSVLGSRVADSGTVGRGTLAALLLSGGGVAANEHFGGPGYLSLLAAAPLVYSRAGSRYMIGDLVPGQKTLADLLRTSAPSASQVGRAYAETRK